MDFMRYCEDIVEPTLEMLVDMCERGYINNEHAIALMHQVTNIDDCLVGEDCNTVHDIIDCTINNFTKRLGGVKYG